MEDMVFVSSESQGRGIDLGWYPDRSPEGQFVIQVVELSDLAGTYAKAIREFKTRSVWEAKRQVEALMHDLLSRNAEPCAAPSGDPAASADNSSVTGGSPSP
jgi:hypothetical protein